MTNKEAKYDEQFVYQKNAVDFTHTKYKWQKMKKLEQNIDINTPPNLVKNMQFQTKLKWFRENLEKLRVHWQNGADYMNIQTTNILNSSLIQASKVNMHKQVKINFIGDKVNDAGGLLRQWSHLVIKQLFDYQTGIFTLAHTEDFTYKLNQDSQIDEDYSRQLLHLFGIVIGKSIFQKIPILSYVDRALLRQLCGKKPQLQDVYGYDIGLYNSWSFIQNNSIEGLDLTFSINKQKKDSTVEEVEIIQGGSLIPVNDGNKSIFINCCIEYYCCTTIQRSVNTIKQALYKIIPQQLLSVFEPNEMEMIINGVPFIDTKDWIINTQYKHPYSATHTVIKWFWKYVEEMDQTQLARLLKFCTGSSRAPIQGFKHLQSNRGNFTKFIIQSNGFNKANPYPKGHTCFNRLELPIYPSQQLLRLYVLHIVNNDLDGVFGLD